MQVGGPRAAAGLPVDTYRGGGTRCGVARKIIAQHGDTRSICEQPGGHRGVAFLTEELMYGASQMNWS